MSLLPFGELPVHTPRQFVPNGADLGEWAQMEPLFNELEKRVRAAKSAADLEKWLLDWGELSAALDEESSKRYIAMTCHTDNAEAEKAYLRFVEEIEPACKPRQFALDQLYLGHPARQELPRHRYEVFDKHTAVRVELFREQNVPLETEEAKLSQQYQKLSGSLTVQFRGEEKTLVQMSRYLEEPDRALREEAWQLVARRRLEEAEKFEEIFDQLVRLREQIAKNAGFSNYRDYAFKARGRFDYTAEDCFKSCRCCAICRKNGANNCTCRRCVRGISRSIHSICRRSGLSSRWRPWSIARRRFSTNWMVTFRRVFG
jgi:oligoendopeptidase F